MLNSKVVLITGCSSGIGKATALAFVKAGYITYATARKPETLGDLKTQSCHTLQLDVTDESSMKTAVQEIERKHSAVDILVNNAGYGLNGPVEELDMANVRHQFETNVFGLVRLSQLVLSGMRGKGWGRIINIGSVGGTFTAPGAGAYHASKWAVESFNDALRYEVKPFGIDVVLIQPTGVYSEFDKKIAVSNSPLAQSSPYKFFMDNHIKVTTEMFSGNSSAGIIKAEDVASVILKAAQARRPRTRYKVGLSAHIYSGLRRFVSDRQWDALMARQFPMQPKRKESSVIKIAKQ
jgi:NAD(P)-dependent dehydrogenase (short-subunit alcohol dehydrogenase family)